MVFWSDSWSRYVIGLYGPGSCGEQVPIQYKVFNQCRSQLDRTRSISSHIEIVQALKIEEHYVLWLDISNRIFGIEHSYEKANERIYEKALEIAERRAKEKGITLENHVKQPNLKPRNEESEGATK